MKGKWLGTILEKKKLSKSHLRSSHIYVQECTENRNDKIFPCHSLDHRYCCKEFRSFITQILEIHIRFVVFIFIFSFPVLCLSFYIQ